MRYVVKASTVNCNTSDDLMNIVNNTELSRWDREHAVEAWLDRQPLGTQLLIQQHRSTMWSGANNICTVEVTQTNPTRWAGPGPFSELDSGRIANYIDGIQAKDNLDYITVTNSGRKDEAVYGPGLTEAEHRAMDRKYDSAPGQPGYRREEARARSSGNRHQLENFYDTHGKR